MSQLARDLVALLRACPRWQIDADELAGAYERVVGHRLDVAYYRRSHLLDVVAQLTDVVQVRRAVLARLGTHSPSLCTAATAL